MGSRSPGAITGCGTPHSRSAKSCPDPRTLPGRAAEPDRAHALPCAPAGVRQQRRSRTRGADSRPAARSGNEGGQAGPARRRQVARRDTGLGQAAGGDGADDGCVVLVLTGSASGRGKPARPGIGSASSGGEPRLSGRRMAPQAPGARSMPGTGQAVNRVHEQVSRTSSRQNRT
jgi:hypothetical protein